MRCRLCGQRGHLHYMCGHLNPRGDARNDQRSGRHRARGCRGASAAVKALRRESSRDREATKRRHVTPSRDARGFRREAPLTNRRPASSAARDGMLENDYPARWRVESQQFVEVTAESLGKEWGVATCPWCTTPFRDLVTLNHHLELCGTFKKEVRVCPGIMEV
jgi:hypothetical protein